MVKKSALVIIESLRWRGRSSPTREYTVTEAKELQRRIEAMNGDDPMMRLAWVELGSLIARADRERRDWLIYAMPSPEVDKRIVAIA